MGPKFSIFNAPLYHCLFPPYWFNYPFSWVFYGENVALTILMRFFFCLLKSLFDWLCLESCSESATMDIGAIWILFSSFERRYWFAERKSMGKHVSACGVEAQGDAERGFPADPRLVLSLTWGWISRTRVMPWADIQSPRITRRLEYMEFFFFYHILQLLHFNQAMSLGFVLKVFLVSCT